MTTIYVISIKNVLSIPELLGSESAKQFFTNVISNTLVNHIVIDFSGVKRMNLTFALQYLKSKQDMSIKNVIKEICMSKNICRAMEIAQKELRQSIHQKLLIKNGII
jgi:anti-anti-sigma regulatory factor